MSAGAPVVAVDLDNTIICYDQAFHRAAVERGWIDFTAPAAKTAVKKAVLAKATEREWTELQGYVYGPGIGAAGAYAGVFDFFRECAARGVSTVIVSHKTQYAAEGPRHDLREAASAWLRASGLLELTHPPAGQAPVVFTSTRAEKLETIRTLRCATLIDDLPEVYRHPTYPPETAFILFDPDGAHPNWTETPRLSTWAEITSRLLP